VPVLDLNDDGQLDFLALISQEDESVEAFINQGGGVFRSRPIWSAPDLTFGSSGIEPVDLDQDGDVDILYTNGDAFDNAYVNPSHGVQWLENQGGFKFARHRIADLIGAFRALATDIDLDGDLDVVATARLPDQQVKPESVFELPLPSLICLEQTSPGEFARHTLDPRPPSSLALEIGDFDNDGDPDIAVGTDGLTVLWNQHKDTVESKGTSPRSVP
jgi:hypothetical protein